MDTPKLFIVIFTDDKRSRESDEKAGKSVNFSGGRRSELPHVHQRPADLPLPLLHLRVLPLIPLPLPRPGA